MGDRHTTRQNFVVKLQKLPLEKANLRHFLFSRRSRKKAGVTYFVDKFETYTLQREISSNVPGKSSGFCKPGKDTQPTLLSVDNSYLSEAVYKHRHG